MAIGYTRFGSYLTGEGPSGGGQPAGYDWRREGGTSVTCYCFDDCVYSTDMIAHDGGWAEAWTSYGGGSSHAFTCTTSGIGGIYKVFADYGSEQVGWLYNDAFDWQGGRDIQFRFKRVTNGGLIFFGLISAASPNEYVWWKLTGTWYCYSGSGGSSSSYNTGITGDTNWHEIRIYNPKSSTAAVEFWYDGELKTTLTTFVSSYTMQPVIRCDSLTLGLTTEINLDWMSIQYWRS